MSYDIISLVPAEYTISVLPSVDIVILRKGSFIPGAMKFVKTGAGLKSRPPVPPGFASHGDKSHGPGLVFLLKLMIQI